MFRLVGQFEGFLFIQSEDECLIFTEGTIVRARKRFERRKHIRNPVRANIDEQFHMFTHNEWKRGNAFALAFQIRFGQCDIFKVYKEESIYRHNIQLRRQKLASLRAKLAADAAGLKQMVDS